jgi:hypothetical protein
MKRINFIRSLIAAPAVGKIAESLAVEAEAIDFLAFDEYHRHPIYQISTPGGIMRPKYWEYQFRRFSMKNQVDALATRNQD